MIIKLFLGVLIIISSTIIGIAMANKYAMRPVQLRALQSGINILQTEIIYFSSPLPEALYKVSKSISDDIRIIFDKASKGLLDKKQYTVNEVWTRAVEDSMDTTTLTEEDKVILINFGLGLGSSDKESQLRHFQLVMEQIKNQEIKAEEIRKKNEKLYKSLGILGGMAITVLIL